MDRTRVATVGGAFKPAPEVSDSELSARTRRALLHKDFQKWLAWAGVDLYFPALLGRAGSSMVEQRPFKPLVRGSSPRQPTTRFAVRLER